MKTVCESLETRRLFAAYVLDGSFGTAGSIDTHDTTLRDAAPSQTFLDGEGRLILVSQFAQSPSGHITLAIRRYHADGTVDKTFDGDGTLVIDLGGTRVPNPQVTLLQDNSIVYTLRQNQQPLFQRITVKGKLDPSFAKNVNGIYKNFIPPFDAAGNDKLYTDPEGRIVFEQYVVGAGPFTTDLLISPEIITARISRYLPSGIADKSFGHNGGMSVSKTIDSPSSYMVKGKVLNRRDALTLTAPQIDADGNVTIAGSRDYERGFNASLNRSKVDLPFLYTFDATNQPIRSFVAGIDSSKASFNSNQVLTYTGLQARAVDMVIGPDGLFYVAGGDPAFFGGGLIIFKPKGASFTVTGQDATFPGGDLQVFGDTVWAKVESIFGVEPGRMVAVNRDASVGQTVGLVGAQVSTEMTYQGVRDNLPERIIGTAFGDEQVFRSLNLTEQEGSVTLDGNGLLHAIGTAGADYINMSVRRDGRIVVTGAGPTRSFPAASVNKIQVDAEGGDDLVEFGLDFKMDAIVNGEAGNDSIFGGNGNDSLDGGSGNDTIQGQPGDDTILGESGDDSLEGNGGADHLFGGSGFDSSFFLSGATYDNVEHIGH